MRTKDCIKWLWRASEGVRGKVVLCSLTGGLHVAASLAFVWICKKLIDAATSGNGENVPLYIGVMIACMLMQILLSAVEQRILNLSDILLKNKLRYRLFNSLMESRWNGKETFHTGDTLNRVMEDVRVVSESITKSTPAVMTAGIQFIAAFLFLFILEPGLAWAIPGIMLAMLIVSRAYVRRMRKLTKDIRTTESSMQSLMQESLQHRLVIHTLERTPYISGNLAEHQEDLREQVMDKTGYSIFTRCFIQLGFSAGYASAFLWGVFGIMNGTATFGMMTAFLQLVGQIQRPLVDMSSQIPSIIHATASIDRLLELEELPMENSGESVVMEGMAGISVEKVSFSYPDSDRDVLHDFSFDFSPGSRTAVVGPTGVGKSTLIRLLLSLLRPRSGTISLYNGTDGKEGAVAVSPATRGNLVYVPQGNTLFSGTIRENLLMGNPVATEAQLRDALSTAAADFVFDLPSGIDTQCFEAGAGLSEGQAQRIAIARALLRPGTILLLDEFSSALDAETETLLLERLTTRLPSHTMIFITHRDKIIDYCDNVLRMG